MGSIASGIASRPAPDASAARRLRSPCAAASRCVQRMTASSEGDGRTVDSVHHPSTATSTPAAAAATAAAAAVNTFRPTRSQASAAVADGPARRTRAVDRAGRSVRSSASEVTTLWRYTNLFIIIIIIIIIIMD